MAHEDAASNMVGPHRQRSTHTRLPCFERYTVVPDLTAVCALTGRGFLGGKPLVVATRVCSSHIGRGRWPSSGTT